MFDWWCELPWWLRIGAGVLCMAAGGLLMWVHISGHFGVDRWQAARYGALLVGAGAVMVLLGGKSDAEKKGYRF